MHIFAWPAVTRGTSVTISIDILLGLGYIPTAGGKDPFVIKFALATLTLTPFDASRLVRLMIELDFDIFISIFHGTTKF